MNRICLISILALFLINAKSISVKAQENQSKIDKNIIGIWDLKDDLVFGTIDKYLEINKSEILKQGNSISATNPVYAANGQIWYTINNNKIYLYDYTIENNKLYFLVESTANYTKPFKEHPRVMILEKRQ